MCTVEEVREGDVLGKSIYMAGSRLLLGAGFRINGEIRQKLFEMGYTHVYIMEEGTEDVIPEDVISDEVRHEAKLRFADNVERLKQAAQFQQLTVEKLRETLEKGNLRNVEITVDVKNVIREILKDITASNTQYMTSILPRSKDLYFFDHAVNTAVLAILLGKRYRFGRDELFTLGLGAFLHDIGKVIIEQTVERSGVGSLESYYREHSTFGYLLLRNDPGLSPLVLQTVNQHHEQQDGNGFPIGLKGTNTPPVKEGSQTKGTIFRFAEICAVADGYDRLLLTPLDGGRRSPMDVIKEMLASAGTVYNRNIVESLIDIIPTYPVGSFVRIVDIVDPALTGCYGVVARVSETNIKRPTIIITANKYRKKIKPIIIDTTKLSRLELKLII
jgi:HD-GYP domain-containing protein (c-di-GMP phosphodiesterase class II)